jgi:hypothetical protein
MVITTDSRAQLATTVSHGTVIGDVTGDGEAIFRSNRNRETSTTLKFDSAYSVSDYWQVSASVPVVKHYRGLGDTEASSTGLGDITVGGAWEFLPELNYSAWKPRGFVVAQVTAPTAPSIYDSTDPIGADVRGRGFWTPSVGMVFSKIHGHFDLLSSIEVHQSLSRKTNTAGAGGELTVKPQPGASLMVGAGYNLPTRPWRFGLSIMPTYEGPIVTEGVGFKNTSAPQYVWNISLQAAYLIESDWTASAAYTDQTLVGPAQNVALSRTFSVIFVHRWSL